MEMGGSGGNFKLASARVVRQPGDGSCLFHSIAYGLGNTNASRLRRELAEWVEAHPDELIAETPLRDWVKWDSASNVRDYARRMAVGGWGGGIEMAACARLKRVNVHGARPGPASAAAFVPLPALPGPHRLRRALLS